MDIELLRAFFPEGLLDYFEVTSYEKLENQYIFHLEEKNVSPSGFKKSELESKGFYEGGTIADFPLRGKPCMYKIKRRKWIHKKDGKVISRDWNIVAKGTRLTDEFASFLKGTN